MKAVAVLLLALVAVAYVAQSEAAYCHVSSYKLPCKKIVSLKRRIYAECKLKVTLGKAHQLKNGCCTLLQKVASKAAWEAYKPCEEKSKNYPLLKAKKGVCKPFQSSKNC